MSLTRILVATDRTTTDLLPATTFAADLASGTGADVVVATAWSPNEQAAVDLPPLGFTNWRTNADTALRHRALQPLVDAGIEHWTRNLDGAPADAVATFAEKHHVGLIVVSGHHRANGSGRVDSFARQLIRRAHCPVTVVPDTAATQVSVASDTVAVT